MKLSDLGPAAQQQIDAVHILAGSLWQAEAAAFLATVDADCADTDALLQKLHQAQRLSTIATADLQNNQAFRDAILAETLLEWKDFTPPPVALSLQHSLGEKLYNITDPAKDVGLISIGNTAREVGKYLVDKCLANKIPFIADVRDPNFNAIVFNHADHDGIKALASRLLSTTLSVTKHMIAGSGTPDKTIESDKAKQHLYTKETKSFHARRMSGEIFYTLTSIPTRRDAQIDAVDYDEYIKMFFESCDQPWDAISAAQGKKGLIGEFNAATKVRITNADGTDVTMSLIHEDGQHMTFCNSVIAKNVPGSEIFSAPRRDSVNGIVVAKGRFSEHGSDIIEDITLEFKDGKLIRFDAAKGLDTLTKILSIDEGALHVGELGIGTNPHLKKHVVNGLLVEKISGSFHLALGDAYKYNSYGTDPVKVDNGNKSNLHWDITTMLRGKGGKIYLDDRLIMDDGKWLDAKYDVLNRGWEAIPRDQRPDYWKDYYSKPPAP